MPIEASVRTAAPSPRRPRAPRWRQALLALAVGATLAGCGSQVVNPVSGRSERTVMGIEDEKKAGREAHAEVLQETPAVADPRLQAYVNEIGQKLAKVSHRPELDWHFTVVDSPDVNAFALPGGYVYVTRGLMALMDSEADLAGVIGHEIGHVTARHSAQRATRQQTAGLGALGGAILGMVLESRGVAGAANVLGQASQAVGAGYVARYSREQESQSDQLGADYLAKAGYNPANMVDVIAMLQRNEQFMQQIARAEGRAAPEGGGWLASHPANDQRLADIRKVTAAMPAGRFGDDQRTRYLRAIDGMTYGDSRDAGVVRGRTFYYEPGGFAWTVPQGLLLQNSPEAVLAVAPAGDSAVVLSAVPAKAGSSHDQILKQGLGALQGDVERIRLPSGFNATRFVGTAQGQQQGTTRPLAVTLIDGPQGKTYLMRAAGRDQASLQRAASALREAEQGLRPLQEADRAAARPWTLRLTPFPAGGYAEFARRSPLPPQRAEPELRLLNAIAINGQGAVRQGDTVKIVQ